jgi:hypothetical protein
MPQIKCPNPACAAMPTFEFTYSGVSARPIYNFRFKEITNTSTPEVIKKIYAQCPLGHSFPILYDTEKDLQVNTTSIDQDNDLLWLNLGATKIQNGDASYTAATDKIDSFLTWLWGVYTAAVGATFIFKTLKLSFVEYVFLLFPVLFIMFSKLYCYYSYMPTMGNYDPRIPDEIKESFNHGFRLKRKKMGFLKLCLAVSVVGIIIALSVFANANLNSNSLQSINQGTTTTTPAK